MQDKNALSVASFVSFSNTKVSIKDEVEHMLTNNCIKLTSKIWIDNSGASSHMAMTTNRMFDLKDYKLLVQCGNKSKLYETKIRKFRGHGIQEWKEDSHFVERCQICARIKLQLAQSQQRNIGV